ncbi:2-amino-4-hydroxy-6-hydroxymethyldihydropteridine diphosphokinase [Microbacterium horticulturae]|uniref:2-amino-4-hydroxy-6-hydroxymethyldihydropteridine diphosphokinase n=1 Tax=Microbacterium horticulturae TaxID=3028316 RepID=A0ABY8BYG5_9MICO|nr:2-amino-4-hydroxy-6-hydroxymethyldihydropteridine diphosphokinase [Microbacterium sp. KACC 23027]WEG09214.1 2-amino-4-hydroxy-6-hydroxymethyldihydropteridine diphosphokinase [Microbacterium sp. KACC 23027]
MNRRLAQGFTPRPIGTPVVIALGANLGDREATLQAAVDELRALPLTDEVRVADAITSIAVKPEGVDAAAPRYLNTVATLTTRLAPHVLLGALHDIENRHGRVRTERWGDRTLDLDIIAYGDVQSSDPDLTLPHPRAAERTFVLDPWLALDPDAQLPGAGPVSVLRERLDA